MSRDLTSEEIEAIEGRLRRDLAEIADVIDAPDEFPQKRIDKARPLLLLAAAAVVLIVGAAALLSWVGGDEDGSPVITDAPTTTTVAPPTTTTSSDDTAVTTTTEPPVDEPAPAGPSVGSAAETWGREVGGPTPVPWRDGFAVVTTDAFTQVDRVWLSDDGMTWERVEVDDPFGPTPAGSRPIFDRVVSGGDHLMVVRTLSDEQGVPQAAQLAATTDLSSWETWTIEPELPDDLPPGMTPFFEHRAVDVTSSGWAATTTLTFTFDLTSLFPPEIGTVFGYTAGEDGIRTENGDVLSWADVGLDWETYLAYVSRDPVHTVSRADWGGDVVGSSGPPWQVLELHVHEPGGLALTVLNRLFWTDDWQTWDEVAPPPDATAYGLAAVANGVVFSDRSGIWLGEPDGSDWRLVELPGLQGRLIQPLFGASVAVARSDGFAIIVDVADHGPDHPGWTEVRVPPPETQPELLVIASPDGERWLVEDLDLGPITDGARLFELSVAINGDRVLVHDGDDVTVYEIP